MHQSALVYGIFTAANNRGMSLNRYNFRLPARRLGMVVDRGNDFPRSIQTQLDSYGSDMWLFRDHSNIGTTRAINSYQGDCRRFNGDLYSSAYHPY
jgi:hypothetical protein